MSVSLTIVGKSENKRNQFDENAVIEKRYANKRNVRQLDSAQNNADKFIKQADKKDDKYSKISHLCLNLGILTFAIGAATSMVHGLAILLGAKLPKKFFFRPLAFALTGLIGGSALAYATEKHPELKNVKTFDAS